MRIVVTFDYPPIPVRDLDYSAVDDSTYGGEESDPIGRGRTPEAAVKDLAAACLDKYDDQQDKLDHEAAQATIRGDTVTLDFIRHLREGLAMS